MRNQRRHARSNCASEQQTKRARLQGLEGGAIPYFNLYNLYQLLFLLPPLLLLPFCHYFYDNGGGDGDDDDDDDEQFSSVSWKFLDVFGLWFVSAQAEKVKSAYTATSALRSRPTSVLAERRTFPFLRHHAEASYELRVSFGLTLLY